MRAYLFGAAGFACAVVMAFAYLADPRTVTKTETKLEPLPAQPTAAQFEAAFRNLEVLGTGVDLNPAGQPVRCTAHDSTGSQDDPDFDWYVMWCVKEGATG